MKVELFAEKLRELGVRTVSGIPDSTLRQFCDYIGSEGKDLFERHIVAENEGACIGIAIGEYLSTGVPACVYMQNSGLGNTVNPLTSLAHSDVYGIPILLIVGWRGEPGIKDEPQHKYMGKITLQLLELLDISFAIVDSQTTEEELQGFLKKAMDAFAKKRQYAFVIRRDTFEKRETAPYRNRYLLKRDCAIEMIAEWLRPDDIVISTTGKISREIYEACNKIWGGHKQTFLTVGGMGHAGMIAYRIAERKAGQRVICLDGDGALLMHMGSLAVIGQNPVSNLVHIGINNEAHESVGGMATGAAGLSYAGIAESSGYRKVYRAMDEAGLRKALETIRTEKQMVFLEVFVAIGSRPDLGRPKETAEENREAFMRFLKTDRDEKGRKK